ncbi:MAG: hypothetical protein WC856_26955 [Methylococcaceae bacterium]
MSQDRGGVTGLRPSPLSHTTGTGHAVFRIRRLNPATQVVAKSDGTHKPQHRNRALFNTVCNIGLRANRHTPADPLACFRDNEVKSCRQASLAKLKGRYAFYCCQPKSKRWWPQLAET